MKKFLSSIAIIGFMFTISPVYAGVAGSGLDQAYEGPAAWGFLIDNPNMIQTFKPTKNTIVSVDVYLMSRLGGSSATLEIIDMDSNAVVAGSASTHELTHIYDDATWETFAYVSPFVSVTPGKTYGLKLSVSDTQTRWGYNSDAYANGVFQATSSPADYDALFRVYGLDQAPAEVTATAAKPNTKAQQAPADSSIAIPVPSAVRVGDDSFEAPVEDTVSIGAEDKLVISGTAFAGATVNLFIGDYNFTGTAGSDGAWTIDVDHSSIKSGEYEVSSQALNNEGKGSEVAKLFTLKKTAPETQVAVTAKGNPSLWDTLTGKYYWETTAGLLSLLLMAVIALHLTQKKHLKTGIPEIGEEKPDLPEPKISKKLKGKIIDITK